MANTFGIDLGTLNLKVFDKHGGQIHKIKNTVSIVKKNQLYAYGDAAYDMYEKAPENISVSFPIVEGVIAEYNNLQTMMNEYLSSISKGHLKGSEYVIAVPTDITEVEKRAFYDLFFKTKSRPKSVLLCDKPIADAVGLGVDVREPNGIMIVDIGSNTTEISVLSLGGIVISELLHFGGNRLDESIVNNLRRNNNLVIGQKTAMNLKEKIGNALPPAEENMETHKVVGINIVTGLPIELEISSQTVYDATKDLLESICNSIKRILEKTPPEVARDVLNSGIYITGGGSKYKNLDQLFKLITGIKVNTCDDPDESCVRGLSKIVTDPDYKGLAYNLDSDKKFS